jgi:hypothetical protein
MKTKREYTQMAKVKFKANAGADIFSCISECIAFSAKNEIPCSLLHNGVEVDVSAFELCNKIQREWDKKLKND